MASNPRKKRKLGEGVSTCDTEKAPKRTLSAIAVRKLQAEALTNDQLYTSQSGNANLGLSRYASGHEISEVHDQLQSDGEMPGSSSSETDSFEVVADKEQSYLAISSASISDAVEKVDGSVTLTIQPGERLLVTGEFDMVIHIGRLKIMGAVLNSGRELHRFYTTAAHSLPLLRCPAEDVQSAKIQLYQTTGGLRSLRRLSKLYNKMLYDDESPLPDQIRSKARTGKSSTFQLVERTRSQPIITPPEWNEKLDHLEKTSKSTSPLIIMVCGPKSSGKSTFAKTLTNRLLTLGKKTTGVAVMDIDPGQPEYSTPGYLSLVHVHEYNFSPPFSHPTHGPKNKLLRAHTIADIVPSRDQDLYIACAKNLWLAYKAHRRSNPNCPLIINTCGMVQGTGLEILVKLITEVQPSDVIYMSTEGPWDVVASLREATNNDNRFYTLPSQVSDPNFGPSSKDLREMQTQSYFHLDPSAKSSWAWNGLPLTNVTPMEVSYSGKNAGILGIMSYGEQPMAEVLLEALNGSLVAVIALHDMKAIPGWSGEDERFLFRDDLPPSNTIDPYDNGDESGYEVRHPLAIRTPRSDLPYFNPLNSLPLKPRYSGCIGQALIRGVDITRKRLQIVTPISLPEIQQVFDKGQKIVLVSGRFDTPGWAYAEGLEYQETGQKSNEKSNELPIDDLPWVKIIEGSKGRGAGAKPWRVRRDLGRQQSGQ